MVMVCRTVGALAVGCCVREADPGRKRAGRRRIEKRSTMTLDTSVSLCTRECACAFVCCACVEKPKGGFKDTGEWRGSGSVVMSVTCGPPSCLAGGGMCKDRSARHNDLSRSTQGRIA